MKIYGINIKVWPEAKEGEVIVINEGAVAEEMNNGYDLPEAFKKTMKYHGKV